MEYLPIEILLHIFEYIPNDIIAISQTCRTFNLIATTQIRKITIQLQRENDRQIKTISKELTRFKALKSLTIKASYDVNISEKAEFCLTHSNKITHLTLSDFSFLNPFFDKINLTYGNLVTLRIENSDLTSSTDELPDFILKCSSLINLRLFGCSGLEITSLNRIGRALCNTRIENLHLHPSYSYFDISQDTRDDSWTIENLKTLSVRSRLVVMKKNFVRNMLGNNRKFPNLRKLELIAELNFGHNFTSVLMNQFPNLESLAIGKGVIDVHNQDFMTLCNYYKSLKYFEFHFIHHDEPLDLRYLQKNISIQTLTIGLTKEITMENLEKMSQSLPGLTHLSIILYYLIPSNQDFLDQLLKIFPAVRKVCFTHIGMVDKIKIIL